MLCTSAVRSWPSALLAIRFQHRSYQSAFRPTYCVCQGRRPSSAKAALMATHNSSHSFIGVSTKKGVPLLLDAFRNTAAVYPRSHLVVAGPDEGGIARDLLPVINDAGLGNRISFAGVLEGDRKRSLLQQSACFVLPSADESFGIAVAEAMAVGCPVVVSPEVAIEGVVRSSGAGIMVHRDPVAIAAAVAQILSDPAKAAAMGAAGRRVVDEQFSWPVVAASMEAFYNSVLSSGRRVVPATPTVGGRATVKRDDLVAVRCPQCRGGLKGDALAATWWCAACGWPSRGRRRSNPPVASGESRARRVRS